MTIFHEIIFKITAMGANNRQFDPELRTIIIFSANYLDFSSWRFKVIVTSLLTFYGPKCLQMWRIKVWAEVAHKQKLRASTSPSNRPMK